MIIDGIKIASAAEIDVPSVEFASMTLDKASITESYIIKQAFGLDVDEIFTQFAGGYTHPITTVRDTFHNQVMKPRDITLRIKLNPQYDLGETPSELRENLLRGIAYSRTGLTELQMMKDNVVIAVVRGHITKFESSLFSEDPEVQIHINCPFPYLTSPNFIEVLDVGWLPGDPFSYEDTLSTAPHGFRFSATLVSPASPSILIQGKAGSEIWPFQVNFEFEDGDFLFFSSQQDNKYLAMIRGSDPALHLTDRIEPGSVWPIFFPGENDFEFPAEIELTSVQHRHHYWGV